MYDAKYNSIIMYYVSLHLSFVFALCCKLPPLLCCVAARSLMQAPALAPINPEVYEVKGPRIQLVLAAECAPHP